MFKNYIIANFRSLWKNKFHTFINITGLSLGISCAVLILVMLRFDLNYDKHHDHPERIYRVVVEYNKNNEHSVSSGLPYAVAAAMRNDFPDVELASLIDHNSGTPVLGIDDGSPSKKLFKEEHTVFVDPDYFSMFNYVWLEGNSSSLNKEKSVVLTESVAKKFFGSRPAVNQIIRYNDRYDITVTGVVQDPPLSSNLPFTTFMSTKLGADKHAWDQWTSSSGGINAYVKLKPEVRVENLVAKMRGWHMKYFTGDEAEGKSVRYYLQPLNEVHFDSRYSSFTGIVTNETLLAMSAIGILLLLTACVNFVNLNTVLIVSRSREVGMRKVLGSSKRQLVFQFLGETFFISILSLILAIPLMEFGFRNVSYVLDHALPFSALADGMVILAAVLIPVIVTLLAGLYPALSLASFQPIRALKNKIYGATGGTSVRRVLIGFQLAVSQGLIICTLIILQQIHFFNNYPVGLNTHAVVEFSIPDGATKELPALRTKIAALAGVDNAAFSNTGAVASNWWGGDFETTVGGQKIKETAQVKFIDERYVGTYQLTLLAGRNVEDGDSARSFLVNEALVRAMGLKSPDEALGIPIVYWGSKKGTVTGVVKNFHSGPLQDKIMPVIFMTGPEFFNTMAVRLEAKDTRPIMDKIEAEWKASFPQFVFQYSFLDDSIASFYEGERKTSRLISIFAVIVVLIGSIGLLGLVSFMVSKRTKEVGIRKTLGASTGSIMTIFSKEFVWLIGISFVIASPVAWYVMQQWLENFAFRIHPGVWTFGAGAMLSFVIVFVTVGVISYKAAVAAPVNALRNE